MGSKNDFLTTPPLAGPWLDLDRPLTDTGTYAHTHGHPAELSWGWLDGCGVPSVP